MRWMWRAGIVAADVPVLWWRRLMNAMAPPQAPMPQPPKPATLLQEALALLRDGLKRDFAVDIETDSTIQPDEQAEKESRVEFLTAVSGFVANMGPVVQSAPQLAPLFGEMLLFGARSFKAGRTMESEIEAIVEQARETPPAPQPDPKAEAEKAKLELEKQKAVQDAEIKQAEMAQNAENAKQELALKAWVAEQEMAIKDRAAQNDMEMKREQQASDAQLKRETANNDMAVKKDMAEASKKPQTVVQFTAEEAITQATQAMNKAQAQHDQQLSKTDRMQTQAIQALAKALASMEKSVAEMNKPRGKRKLRVLRDGSGLIQGAEED